MSTHGQQFVFRLIISETFLSHEISYKDHASGVLPRIFRMSTLGRFLLCTAAAVLLIQRCSGSVGSATLLPVSNATNANESKAYGLASLALVNDSLIFSIVAVDLSGPITGAYFFRGEAAAAGDQLFTICNQSRCESSYLTGTWPNASTFLSEKENVGVYINLCTAANINGEVSGRIIVPFPDPPPFLGVTELSGPARDAHGIATYSLSQFDGNLSYTIVATNLSGPITAAHFHEGTAAESNGSVIATICAPCLSNHLHGVWTNTSAYSEALAAGGVYINLHTAANPAGEIRGQVTGAAGGGRAAAAAAGLASALALHLAVLLASAARRS